MTDYWRCGMLFCNSFLIFGVFYFLQIPIGLQNEIMDSKNSYNNTNNTRNHTSCYVCLGLGELRYNILFSVSRWTSLVLCVPFGLVIDRLGNVRSALLISSLSLLGSVLFGIGSMSTIPVTTPMYLMMAIGYGLVAVGDGPLRFVQARVAAYCFPKATFTALAFSMIGFSGQAISFYVTPNFAKVFGPIPAVWLGVSFCGFGVMCAVGLAFLLSLKSTDVVEDMHANKTMTLRELWDMPGTYWLHTLGLGFSAGTWFPKQNNLPDYLEFRYGYTMTEASYIAGIPTLIFLLIPLFSIVQRKIDCNGILITLFLACNVPLYAILGFCPAVNVYAISVADGISISVVAVLGFQLLVVLCPTSYIGTLAGVMFLARNTILALIFVAAGYILDKRSLEDTDKTLRAYQQFFLMLVITSSTGVLCWVMMNVLDLRKGNALNSRIRKWRQSKSEEWRLMPMEQPSNQYSSTGNLNEGTGDSTMISDMCNED